MLDQIRIIVLHRHHHYCHCIPFHRYKMNSGGLGGGGQFWHRRLPERSAYRLILKRSTVGVCLPHVYLYIFTHIHPHAHTRRLVKVSVTWIHSNLFLVHMRLYFHHQEENWKLLKKKVWIHLSFDDTWHFLSFLLFIKALIKTTILCHPLHV